MAIFFKFKEIFCKKCNKVLTSIPYCMHYIKGKEWINVCINCKEQLVKEEKDEQRNEYKNKKVKMFGIMIGGN